MKLQVNKGNNPKIRLCSFCPAPLPDVAFMDCYLPCDCLHAVCWCRRFKSLLLYFVEQNTDYFIHPIAGNYSVNSHIKNKTKKQKQNGELSDKPCSQVSLCDW